MNIEKLRVMVMEGLQGLLFKENKRLRELQALAESETPPEMKTDNQYGDERDATERKDAQTRVESGKTCYSCWGRGEVVGQDNEKKKCDDCNGTGSKPPGTESRRRRRTEDDEPDAGEQGAGVSDNDTPDGRGDQAGAFSDETGSDEIPNDFEGYIEYALGANAPEGTPPEELEGMVDVLIEFADSLAENGELPPFPGEEATAEDKASWVGSAKVAGFVGRLGEYIASKGENGEENPPETPPDMGDEAGQESRGRRGRNAVSESRGGAPRRPFARSRTEGEPPPDQAPAVWANTPLQVRAGLLAKTGVSDHAEIESGKLSKLGLSDLAQYKAEKLAKLGFNELEAWVADNCPSFIQMDFADAVDELVLGPRESRGRGRRTEGRDGPVGSVDEHPEIQGIYDQAAQAVANAADERQATLYPDIEFRDGKLCFYGEVGVNDDDPDSEENRKLASAIWNEVQNAGLTCKKLHLDGDGYAFTVTSRELQDYGKTLDQGTESRRNEDESPFSTLSKETKIAAILKVAKDSYAADGQPFTASDAADVNAQAREMVKYDLATVMDKLTMTLGSKAAKDFKAICDQKMSESRRPFARAPRRGG